MGKRSNFKRRKQDAYFSPPEVVDPLLPWLPDAFRFDEPCAGNGALADALLIKHDGAELGKAMDVDPQRRGIIWGDALTDYRPGSHSHLIITNPPWTRELLHPMIERFRKMRPTWLLFDADWMHTVQAEPYLPYCARIVSVGRVSWMQNKVSGLDNCAWYLFGDAETKTEFNGRKKK